MVWRSVVERFQKAGIDHRGRTLMTRFVDRSDTEANLIL